MRRIVNRLSPTALIACIALPLGLGGTAVAATVITGKEIRDGTVTGVDIKDRSLTKADFNGDLTGPRGPVGPTGPAGPAGPAGITGYEYRIQRQDVPARSARSWEVSCTGDKRALGGGVSSNLIFEVNETAPTNETRGWAATVRNRAGVDYSAYVWVICANVS